MAMVSDLQAMVKRIASKHALCEVDNAEIAHLYPYVPHVYWSYGSQQVAEAKLREAQGSAAPPPSKVVKAELVSGAGERLNG